MRWEKDNEIEKKGKKTKGGRRREKEVIKSLIRNIRGRGWIM